jgi:asparagine synthase (glutamine-hydrolysing)
VQRHIQAEVPSGLFLSGGVDSTLILAISRELGYRHLPVFSVANAENETSFGTRDYHFARLAARQFDAGYHEIRITNNLLTDFNSFLQHIDQPIGDSAAWLTFLLAQAAKPHIKVVLSGAGADELFAGYHRHWAYYQYLKHYSWLKPLLPALKKSAFLLPTGTSHPLRQPFRLAYKMLMHATSSRKETFVNFTAHLPAFYRQNDVYDSFPGQKNIDLYLKHALQYDQSHFLSADVLALTDRMTMQANIEARVPYLDAELSTLMASIPAGFLLKKGRKWILKEILVRKGGEIYAKRRKEGFGMPFGQWLKTTQGKPLIDLLQNRKCITYNFISFNEVNELLKAHLRGKTDYSSELWTLILVVAWIEKEFGITHTS